VQETGWISGEPLSPMRPRYHVEPPRNNFLTAVQIPSAKTRKTKVSYLSKPAYSAQPSFPNNPSFQRFKRHPRDSTVIPAQAGIQRTLKKDRIDRNGGHCRNDGSLSDMRSGS
jgi:hypothetical protein